ALWVRAGAARVNSGRSGFGELPRFWLTALRTLPYSTTGLPLIVALPRSAMIYGPIGTSGPALSTRVAAGWLGGGGGPGLMVTTPVMPGGPATLTSIGPA